MFLGKLVMENYGQGICDSGYYGGWDGQGDNNVEDCKSLCLQEDQCQYAAYYSGPEIILNGRKKTCTRYNGASCKLRASTNIERGHKTFKKTLPTG